MKWWMYVLGVAQLMLMAVGLFLILLGVGAGFLTIIYALLPSGIEQSKTFMNYSFVYVVIGAIIWFFCESGLFIVVCTFWIKEESQSTEEK